MSTITGQLSPIYGILNITAGVLSPSPESVQQLQADGVAYNLQQPCGSMEGQHDVYFGGGTQESIVDLSDTHSTPSPIPLSPTYLINTHKINT